MNTGFSLWELTYREFPVSLTGFGFTVYERFSASFEFSGLLCGVWCTIIKGRKTIFSLVLCTAHRWGMSVVLLVKNYIQYTHHHNPSWISTIHIRTEVSEKTPWKQRNGLAKWGDKYERRLILKFAWNINYTKFPRWKTDKNHHCAHCSTMVEYGSDYRFMIPMCTSMSFTIPTSASWVSMIDSWLPNLVLIDFLYIVTAESHNCGYNGQ